MQKHLHKYTGTKQIQKTLSFYEKTRYRTRYTSDIIKDIYNTKKDAQKASKSHKNGPEIEKIHPHVK